MKLSNFSDFFDIDFFLLDMDGTIYLGNSLFEWTPPFFKTLAQKNKRFLFLTNNSSRAAKDYVKKLNSMGIEASEKDVLTSGDAAAEYLKSKVSAPRVFLLGTPELQRSLESQGIKTVQADPDFVLLGFDTTLTYDKVRKACDFIRRGVPFVATHPDFNCPVEEGMIPDAGSMAAMITASTGVTPAIVGKPEKTMAEAALRRLGASAEKTAVVGDRLYTDIALGQNAGIFSVLVLSGETSKQAYESQSDYRADLVIDNIGLLAKLIK